MSEPGSVTNRSGELWSCGLTTPEIYRTLQRLEAPSFRSLKEALERVRLDPVSRREDGNTLDTPEDADHRTNLERKFNKGLAMEVVASAALTAVDHTEKVHTYWTLKEGSNLPNRHAPSRVPDVYIPPTGEAPEFQIVCEVSSGRTMTPKYLRKQLKSALKHCMDKREEASVVTYGLLVNSGKIGTDRNLQRTYRKFIADNADEENGLEALAGPIRLVIVQTLHFSMILRRLYARRQLAFPRQSFVRALDELHARLRSDIPKPPKKRTRAKKRSTPWMVGTFIDTVTAEPDLIDGAGSTDGDQPTAPE